MARFSTLDQRLDPYWGTTNFGRARELQLSRERWAERPWEIGLSVVVLNLDAPELLTSILDGFDEARRHLSGKEIPAELIVGDTGSLDEATLRLMDEARPGVSYLRGLEYQFSRNNNDLFDRVRYQTTLFLNNDVLVAQNPNSIVEAYWRHRESAEIVSTLLEFGDGRLQHGGVDFLIDPHLFGLPFHPEAGSRVEHAEGSVVSCRAVTGAFLMIDSVLFSRLGGFDENYAAECQDIDLCLRAHRLGVGCEVLDVGPLIHLENATRPKGEENWADRRRFVRRWSSYIETL